MADKDPSTDGPHTAHADGYKFELLPDWDNDFVDEQAIETFARALAAPETSPSNEDLTSPDAVPQEQQFITALNDWRPIHQRVRRPPGSPKKRRKKPRRGKDETREGFVYLLLKWPLLFLVLGWILVLGASYFATRIYVFLYEHFFIMRGKRQALRKRLRSSRTYAEWVQAATDMDAFLGNDRWKETDDYAYYNSQTVRSVRNALRKLRANIEHGQQESQDVRPLVDEMRILIEAAVKDNFVGVENPRLYSETYYGTKRLVQSYVDEVEMSLKTLLETPALTSDERASVFRHLYTNHGRSALCLSGGATFAYYHFGVAKALLDANTLPQVITGTSGGALVAALLGTRTDDELKRLLVPALANRITACHDQFSVWIRRWWRTGARFDSVDWARRCGWFCRGNLTFKEAFERTGRILNVSCVPSDPHSPTILANYKTSPDCVIWSAVLASAAVPAILNPVVLMKKLPDGSLAPYSFGHKWKDGSLRTDIPLRALNTHFNVNFSIVSQVNPHINLFFFSSRGTVGRPVTHRRGRGWRGGFLGSAAEQYLKLDLTKWLKVLRHLELLPRYYDQDWSEVWLQRFSGTVTIWPKSIPSDFVNILSDPSVERLARMIHVGQQSTFPKLKFIGNRTKLEKLIEQGRKSVSKSAWEDEGAAKPKRPALTRGVLSEEDLRGLLRQATMQDGFVRIEDALHQSRGRPGVAPERTVSPTPSLSQRLSGWWSRTGGAEDAADTQLDASAARRGSVMAELTRQSRVFFDDDPSELSGSEVSTAGEGSIEHDERTQEALPGAGEGEDLQDEIERTPRAVEGDFL